MKILIDARPIIDAPYGGIGRVALALTRALAENYPDDIFVCITTGNRIAQLPAELSACKNIQHIHKKIPNKIWSLGCMLGIFSLSAGCDVALFPNIGFIGRIKIPYAILVHDISFLIEPHWFTYKQRLWHWAVRAVKCISRANIVFAVSHTTARDIEKFISISSKKISVLPMGHTIGPDTKFKNQTPPSIPSSYAVCLGLGDPRKNITTAIEAMRQLRIQEKFSDMKLVLIGKQTKKISENWIIQFSDIEDDALISLYKNASIFLYPSWYEGYGLPVHEAASFNIPCISSISGALPETAPPNILFANPTKPHHWVIAMECILSNEKKIHTENIYSKHTWIEAAHTIKNSLQTLL